MIEHFLDEMRKVVRLGGDTYSSYEVVGLLRRAADEIERLRAEAKEKYCVHLAETIKSQKAEIERLRAEMGRAAEIKR